MKQPLLGRSIRAWLLVLLLMLAGCTPAGPDFAKIIHDSFFQRALPMARVEKVENIQVARAVQVGEKTWCVLASYDITLTFYPFSGGAPSTKVTAVKSNKFYIRQKPLCDWEVEGDSSSC